MIISTVFTCDKCGKRIFYDTEVRAWLRHDHQGGIIDGEEVADLKQMNGYWPTGSSWSYNPGKNNASGGGCLHDSCPKCHGTGTGPLGPCIHGIACPCPKCSPTC